MNKKEQLLSLIRYYQNNQQLDDDAIVGAVLLVDAVTKPFLNNLASKEDWDDSLRIEAHKRLREGIINLIKTYTGVITKDVNARTHTWDSVR